VTTWCEACGQLGAVLSARTEPDVLPAIPDTRYSFRIWSPMRIVRDTGAQATYAQWITFYASLAEAEARFAGIVNDPHTRLADPADEPQLWIYEGVPDARWQRAI
jgi:hypothetical protein